MVSYLEWREWLSWCVVRSELSGTAPITRRISVPSRNVVETPRRVQTVSIDAAALLSLGLLLVVSGENTRLWYVYTFLVLAVDVRDLLFGIGHTFHSCAGSSLFS